MKTAVIVAAGKSSRLYPLTLECPKGLLEVNKEKILERSVRQLKEAGVENIIIVVGYLHEKIEQVFDNDSSVEFIRNPFFEHCNNMGSLWFALNILKERKVNQFVYLHGDIVYDTVIIRQILEEAGHSKHFMCLSVDFSLWDEESMKVKIKDNCMLETSSKDIPLEDANGEWTGIATISDTSVLLSSIDKILLSEDLNLYDTYCFNKLAAKYSIKCININAQPWIEIDFLKDYEKAKDLFS